MFKLIKSSFDLKCASSNGTLPVAQIHFTLSIANKLISGVEINIIDFYEVTIGL